MPEPDQFLTATEVAEMARVAKSTVFRWVETGDLEAVRLGAKVIRFRRSDVERFLAVGSVAEPVEPTEPEQAAS